MENKYQIRQYVVGGKAFVTICEQAYMDIKSAKENLFETLHIEEKLDLVLGNYFDLENFLLTTSLDFMIYRTQDYTWLQKNRGEFSRKIVNLLAGCRLYADQIIHHLNNIFGSGSGVVV